MNLDTGAAVNTFPLNFSPDEEGEGSFYRTASVCVSSTVELGSFKATMKMVRVDL